jgi:nucleotide-binding universal stress UspA family protein
MIHKILVAYDGSQMSEHAFSFALDQAKKYQAELFILAVARPPEPPEDVETEAILENAQEYYEKLFVSLKEKASGLNLVTKFKIAVGHPAEQIVSFAEQNGTDLIVMGHASKTLFKRLLLGSVSHRVINLAHCAVTIVR